MMVDEELNLIQGLIDRRYRDLRTEILNQAKKILWGKETEEVVQAKFGFEITIKKLMCLKPNTWLNDEVINFYMHMLIAHDIAMCNEDPSRKRSHLFSSFFMERLLVTDGTYMYLNIEKWSKGLDIFELDKLFFPINIDNTHWALAVVFPQLKQIHYFDSMGNDGEEYMSSLRQWVIDEAKSKKNLTLNPNDWTLVCRHDIPQQDNGWDCGVFTVACADFLLDNLPLNENSYSQAKMEFWREKIAVDILNGYLSYTL